jgi:hypothetical protein
MPFKQRFGPVSAILMGAALRRMPLLAEVLVRSLVMTFVIVIVGLALQIALYAELTDRRQGMLFFTLPPIPYGLFKKNSQFPSAASAY